MLDETFDYHARPAVTDETVRRVLGTLAAWLPGEDGGAALAAWDEAAWLAAEWLTYWQSALPWFARRLAAAGVTPPAAVGARLAAVAAGSGQRTLAMLDGLAALLRRLRALGVAAVPLKGAVLAPLYYPDARLRPLGDVDLFVRRGDVARVEAVLQETGYTFFKRTAKEVVYVRGTRHPHNVWAADNLHPIEVQHATLNEYAGIRYDLGPWVWRGAVERPFGGGTAAVPDPVTLLQHVCAHATEDWLLQRGKLIQLIDVQLVARRLTAAEWAAFAARVDAHGARFLYPVLAFVARRGETAVPAEVLARLAALSPPRLRAWAAETELADVFERADGDEAWFEARLSRLLVRSRREQLRVAARLAFPPRWHFRLQAWPRLQASPAWPLVYVVLNGQRVGRILAKGWARAAVGREIGD